MKRREFLRAAGAFAAFGVAGSHAAPPATPPPGGRGPRAPMLPDSFMILVVGK